MAMVRLIEKGFVHPLALNREISTANFFRAICHPGSPWTLRVPAQLATMAPTDKVFIIPTIGSITEQYISCGGQGVDSWVPSWNIQMPSNEESLDGIYSVGNVKAAHAFWKKAKELPDTSTIKQVIFGGIQVQLFVIFGVLSCVWLRDLVLHAYSPGKEILKGTGAGFPDKIGHGAWKITDSVYGVRYISDNTEIMEVTWSS